MNKRWKSTQTGDQTMSKIGEYIIDRLDNGETMEEIIEKGFNNEDSEYQR